MIGRLRAALPTRRTALVGALVWGLLIAANAVFGLLRRGWPLESTGTVALVYLAGALLAFGPAIFVARLLAGARGRDTRFAAHLLSLAAFTTAVTGGLYALDYRAYYAQWHEPAFTRIWAIQFAFTSAVALYEFAVLGVRLMFPFGFAGLFAASVLLSRRH